MTKVLIVEDQEMMLSLLKTLLEMEHFQVETLQDATQSSLIETIRQKQPDALLLDVRLKSSSGLDLLTALRQDPTYDRLKILMTSGEDLRAQCLQRKADNFLLKPYMPEDLLNWLHEV